VKEESGSTDDNEHTTFTAAGNTISLWSALLQRKKIECMKELSQRTAATREQ
jgi:hypothetical protein